MEPAVFDHLEQSLHEQGPGAAIDRLCAVLRERKDYGGLFYALLLKKRHELGVSPVPSGPASDLPEEVHEPYEEAIRQAGRLVGRLYLDEGNIPQAWAYFRMLSEPGPVAEALELHTPKEDEDMQQLVDIAFYQGVHPRKGFDWILERFGLCNSITTLSSQELGLAPDTRLYCIRRLVRALYAELGERLVHDIVRHGQPDPATRTVRELIAARDWLFEGDGYHVDISHLGAVVQFAVYLPPGEELEMAREFCAYGRRLSSQFRSPGEPPFEDLYADHAIYLAALAGDDREAGLNHFRAKVDRADPERDGTRPAEVLVNLLLRVDRAPDALAVARRHLTQSSGRPLSCPGLLELCQRTGDYRTLAEVAREQDDLVHFLAGRLAEQIPSERRE